MNGVISHRRSLRSQKLHLSDPDSSNLGQSITSQGEKSEIRISSPMLMVSLAKYAQCLALWVLDGRSLGVPGR